MNKNNPRSGQALLLGTLSLCAMLGMMGLAVDLGWGYYRREAAQTAADAAASAAIQAALNLSPSSQACGTSNIWCGSPAGTATACPATAPTSPATTFDYACALAGANGFTTTGSRTVTIQANNTSSAPTVPGTTVAYWATVRVSENTLPFFGAPGGGGGLLSAAARTTAAVITSNGAVSSACLYVLGQKTSTNALSITNGSNVTTSSCGVWVNSTASSAMTVQGATLTSTSVNVVGGITWPPTNGGCIDTPTGGCNSLHPNTGAAAIPDPFVSLPSPTPSGTCNPGNFTNWQPSAYQLSAGTYCNFNLGNGMSAVMGPGIYVINGGSFNIQNGGGTLTATGGVMVYLTNGATANIANGTSVTLSAMSTGAYEGVLFYQDRTMTSPGASTFAGGANMNLTGSLYFPKAALTINNGSRVETLGVVADSVNFAGGTVFKQATTVSQTGLGTTGSTSVAVIE